jgi:ABC-type nitrate/sulfonate/bicarbonate transport system substrate-binding protein
VTRRWGSRTNAAKACALVVVAIIAAACGSSSSGSTPPATTSSPPASASTSASPTGLISAAECAANKAAGTITYVSPFGFDASAGIIDVFAAEKLGYFKDLCLTVKFITNSQDSTALVSAGKAQVTNVGSAADYLSSVISGANIQAVATYGDTSDYCIITKKSITSLKQLEGATLGYHFVKEAPVLAMLAAAGVDTSKVKFVNTSNYDPNQVVQGKIDAVGCYQSNEPLTLKAEGAQFNEFTPAQFNVTGTFNVQFFNKKFLAAHDAAAKDWMRADLHALDYCTANQAACVNIEGDFAKAAGSDFVTSHEKQVWALESALANNHTLPGQGVGVQSVAEFQPEAKELVHFGLAKSVPPLASVMDNTMVASLYNGKTLIWP